MGALKEGIEAAFALFLQIGFDLKEMPYQIVNRVFATDTIPVTGPDGQRHNLVRRRAVLEDGTFSRPVVKRFTPKAGVTYEVIEVKLDDRSVCFPLNTKTLEADELAPPDQSILDGVIFRMRPSPRTQKMEPVAHDVSGKVILPTRGFVPKAYTQKELDSLWAEIRTKQAGQEELVSVDEFIKRYRLATVEKAKAIIGYDLPVPVAQGFVTNETSLALLDEVGGTIPADLYTVYHEGRRYEAFAYLGLGVDATESEVKKAFRQQARFWNWDTIEAAIAKVKKDLKRKTAGVEVIEEHSNEEGLKKIMEDALEETLKAEAAEWEKRTGRKANDVTMASIKRDTVVLNTCYERAITLCQRRAHLDKLEKLKLTQCKGQTESGRPCRSQGSKKGGHDPKYCARHQVRPDDVPPAAPATTGDQPEAK